MAPNSKTVLMALFVNGLLLQIEVGYIATNI